MSIVSASVSPQFHLEKAQTIVENTLKSVGYSTTATRSNNGLAPSDRGHRASIHLVGQRGDGSKIEVQISHVNDLVGGYCAELIKPIFQPDTDKTLAESFTKIELTIDAEKFCETLKVVTEAVAGVMQAQRPELADMSGPQITRP